MVTTIDPIYGGKIIWPWSEEDEEIWAKDILERYGEVTHQDRDLHNRIHGMKDSDVEFAMRRRLGLLVKEESAVAAKKKKTLSPDAAATTTVDPSSDSDLKFIPSPKFQGTKPGYVFRLVPGIGLGYHRDDQQQQQQQQQAKTEKGNNDDGKMTGKPAINEKDPKLATLREHRRQYPSLTHKQRLQALQQADNNNVWANVSFKAFTKIINKDNKLTKEQETKEPAADINEKDPKFASLREHRRQYPSLTHKQRLQALQQADNDNLWANVSFKAFKKLINKDNQLNKALEQEKKKESTTKTMIGRAPSATLRNNNNNNEMIKSNQIIGKIGYTNKQLKTMKSNYGKTTPSQMIGKTGYTSKTSTTTTTTTTTDLDKMKLPIQPYPGCPYPCQLCGRSLNPRKYASANIQYCRSDGWAEGKSLKWALDSDLYHLSDDDVVTKGNKVIPRTMVICRYCDPPQPWGTGPALTTKSKYIDYLMFSSEEDDDSEDSDDYYYEDIMGGGRGGSGGYTFGFSEDDAYELLCHGINPWEDDAAYVLAAIRGHKNYY